MKTMISGETSWKIPESVPSVRYNQKIRYEVQERLTREQLYLCKEFLKEKGTYNRTKLGQ